MPYAGWHDRPFALIGRRGSGVALSAVNATALQDGLGPGMPLTDARALQPALSVAPEDPVAEAATLARLADWCGRFTPWTREDPAPGDGNGAGIWLDVSGCAHLFGGETALLSQVTEKLAALAFPARAGLADSPGAAWAAARHLTSADQPFAQIPTGAARQMLSRLPPEALRLPAKTLETLERLGIRRVEELLALPRAPLVNRFGPETAKRLDQALGRLPEPINPRRPPAPSLARLAFAEPIGQREDIALALRRLLTVLCDRLEQDHRGARALELCVFRVDGSVARAAVGTARPDRSVARLARLFDGRLDSLDPGFGIEALTVSLLADEPLTAQQKSWTDKAAAQPSNSPAATAPGTRTADQAAELAALADRLGARLGTEALRRPHLTQHHRPERAWIETKPFTPAPKTALSSQSGNIPPVGQKRVGQPVRLYGSPRAVPLPWPVSPEAYPRRDPWRDHAPDWWVGPAADSMATRWVRVETPEGLRLTLARAAPPGPEEDQEPEQDEEKAKWACYGVCP